MKVAARTVPVCSGECTTVGSGQLAELATAVADELGEQGRGQVVRGVIDKVAQSAEVLLMEIEVPGHDEQRQFE